MKWQSSYTQHARHPHDKHSRSKVLDGGSRHEKLGECCRIDGTAIGTLRYDLAVLDTLAIAMIFWEERQDRGEERRSGKVAVFVVICRFVCCSPWSAGLRAKVFNVSSSWFWYLEAIWDSNAANVASWTIVSGCQLFRLFRFPLTAS